MKYIDYTIVQAFDSRRGKRDFISLIDREYMITISDTPENRVFYLDSLYRNKGEKQDIFQHQIFLLESQIIEVLARMEMTGVAMDEQKLQDIGVRLQVDLSKIESEIYEVLGERINIHSPKQLQVIFFEKLGIKPTKKNKTGYSVDVDVLEEIAKTHDIARLILEYRTLSKLLSTYVEGLSRSITHDKKIHTRYDSLGAATGRMSSNDPNLQNIPTGDGYAHEIKECFIPSHPENILLVADYSQIELRVLAFLSQDQNLLDAFIQNEDIHMRTARFLFPHKTEITSHERRIAKSVNFGVIYGITGFGLSKTLNCSPQEAQKYIDAFYDKYPGVRIYYDTLLESARVNGYVETFFGRRRYIAGINDANKTIRSIAEREAMNMPVQGTAADILKIAMVEIDAKICNMKTSGKMILQVHDELVFDIPQSEQDVWSALVRDTMQNILNQSHTSLQLPPILVDISFGENWAQAKG